MARQDVIDVVDRTFETNELAALDPKAGVTLDFL